MSAPTQQLHDEHDRPPCPWGQHRWHDRPSADRSGWRTTSCEICGKVLGMRPAELPGGQPGQRIHGGTYA